MTRTGQLRHRVTIYKPALGEPDDYGQVAETSQAIATVFAEITPLSGQELLVAKQVTPQATHQVRIRYREDVDARCHLIWRLTRRLELQEPPRPDERGQFLVFSCKEVP